MKIDCYFVPKSRAISATIIVDNRVCRYIVVTPLNGKGTMSLAKGMNILREWLVKGSIFDLNISETHRADGTILMRLIPFTRDL